MFGIILLVTFQGLLAKVIHIEGTEILTKDTEIFLDSVSMYNLGFTRNQKNYYLVEVDSLSNFSLNSMSNNGDLSIAPEEIYNVWKDKKELDISGYSIFYNYSDKVYVSNNQPRLRTNITQINCRLDIPDAVNKVIGPISSITRYSKIAHYYRHAIGLKGNSMYNVYDNTILAKEDIIEDFFKSNVKDFWISSNIQSPEKHLTIITNDIPLKIIVFQFNNNYETMSLKHIRNITEENIGIENLGTINDVKIYKNITIIATSTQLVFAMLQTNNTFNSISYQDYNNFTSLTIYSTALYTISYKQGLYIFNLTNPSNSPIIAKHSRMLSIDFVQNPFTGNDFLGILLDTSKHRDEFFIELLIKSPFDLVTNKIFCLKNNNIQLYTTPDSFYSYFYNEQNSRIYRIRRGILNRINDIIYSIEITSKITAMTNYYDSISDRLLPATVSSDSLTPLDIVQPKTELSCNITSAGTYYLQYSRFTDACASNLQLDQLAICRKIIIYKVIVKTNQLSPFLISVFILVSIAILVVIILTIVFCGKYNRGFKQNNLKLIVAIDKNNKDELYEERNDDRSIDPLIHSKIGVSDLIMSTESHLIVNAEKKNDDKAKIYQVIQLKK